jgi:putative PIN family toxin of toxin-antitoxin system
MRVVLDTNVLISGLLNNRGAPGQVLDAWRSGDFELVCCAALVEEFKRACGYPRLASYLVPADVGELVNRLRSAECWLSELPRLEKSEDPGDDFLLAMAQASSADYLVSGDDAGLLAIGHLGRTQIVTAASFLAVLR